MQRLFVTVSVALLAGVAWTQGQEQTTLPPAASAESGPGLEARVRRIEERLEDQPRQVAELKQRLEVEGAGAALEEADAPTRRPGERGIELGLPGPLAGTRLYGHVVAGYTWNVGDPDERREGNRLRLSDQDHNTFNPSSAWIGLERPVSGENELDAGFKAELLFGRLAQTALREDGVVGDEPLNAPQAYAQLQLGTPWGRPVTIRAGRFELLQGGETLYLPENRTYSLGYLATFGPRTFTGLSAEIELAPGLSYTQLFGNGWDSVIDENDSKTLGGQLRWERTEIQVKGTWLVGRERAGNEHDTRWLVGVNASFQLWGAEVFGAALYGEEEGADLRDHGLARFGGFGVGVRRGFFRAEDEGHDRLSLVLRGEAFRDRGGSRSGEHQDLAQVTAGVEVRPVSGLALRLEYRHDWSSEDSFEDRHGPADNQGTLGFAASYSF